MVRRRGRKDLLKRYQFRSGVVGKPHPPIGKYTISEHFESLFEGIIQTFSSEHDPSFLETVVVIFGTTGKAPQCSRPVFTT